MNEKLKKDIDTLFDDCKIRVKAPASIYLAGDFTDSWGSPAIIQTIPLYVHAGLKIGSASDLYRESPENYAVELYCIQTVEQASLLDDTGSSIVKINEFDQKYSLVRYVQEEFWPLIESREKEKVCKIKILSEVPTRCGLNTSASISVCFAVLLYMIKKDVGIKEMEEILSDMGNTFSTAVMKKGKRKLKSERIFREIITEAWVVEHNFSPFHSGASVFAALLAGSSRNLLFYIRDNPLEHIPTYDVSAASQLDKRLMEVEKFADKKVESKTYREIKKDIGDIGIISYFTHRNYSPYMESLIVFSGKPIPSRDAMEQIFPQRFFERLSLQSIGISKGIFRDIKKPTNAQGWSELQKEIFSLDGKTILDKEKMIHAEWLKYIDRSMAYLAHVNGLLAWYLLRLFIRKDTDDLKEAISILYYYQKFLGVVSKEARECIEYIKKIDDTVAMKVLGGDVLVLGAQNSIEKVYSLLKRKGKYQVHFCSIYSGWTAEGLTFSEPLSTEMKGGQEAAISGRDPDALVLGVNENGRPYVKIRGSKKSIEPRLFPLLLLLAAKKTQGGDGRVDKRDEIDGFIYISSGEQKISDLRNYLNALLDFKEDSPGSIPPSEDGMIWMTVDKEKIIIDDSVRFLEIDGRNRLVTNIRKVFRSIEIAKLRKAGGAVTPEEVEELFAKRKIKSPRKYMENADQKIKDVLLAQYAVEKVLELEFHRNEWKKELVEIIEMVEEIMVYTNRLR